MTRYSLDELRQRYVVEGRPLEASVEEILRADSRGGARAILVAIEKRMKRFSGIRGRMPLLVSMRPE
ncbi:hypothetical protein ABIF63_003511 [Bradyrhizobium japonicum]|uniref:Uncharacterized protein n=1 Tax=Bradyrhizobium japonicum TaxID=375 RepID=A0ABV2RR67_BRAJP